VLGTGTGALLGGDLTDPENDINDNVAGNPPYSGTGYNWVNAFASAENYFSPGGPENEAALDLFDNKLGGGEAKWYDFGQQGWVALEFALPQVLTHFTVSSANDEAARDPDVWRIQGSNDSTDGVDGNWTDIFTYDVEGTSAWGDTRQQVVRWDSPSSPNPGADFAVPDQYTWIKFDCDSTVSNTDGQLGEIELFGIEGITAEYTWANSPADGNWGSGLWNKDPDTSAPDWPVYTPPTDLITAIIGDDAHVHVAANQSASYLEIGASQLTVDTGKTLTINGTVDGSRINVEHLATLSAGGGDLDELHIAGTATVAGSLNVANLSDDATVATLVKTGNGSVTLGSVTAVLGSTLQVDGGTLAVGGASPIGSARAVKLNGGTFQITADSGIPAVNPGLVTTGLKARFDAAAITEAADGGDVAAWPDSAGTYDATTMSATSPQWIQSVPELNGNPAVRFDDTGTEWLEFADINDIRTVFWIVKDSAPGNIQFLLGDDVTYHFHGDIPGYIWSGWTSGNVLNGTTELNGEAIDGRTTLHPLEYSILSVATTGPVEASRIAQDRTIADRGWRGDIADILIYNEELTAEEKYQVTTHLANRYGMTIPLPIAMTGTNFTVTDDSTLDVLGAGPAQFGKLTLGSTGVATITGTVSSVTFTGGTEILDGATTVGVAPELETTYGTISGAATTGPFTFTKAGAASLAIEPGGVNEMTGMSNATINAAGGTLTMTGSASWAGSTKAQLSGGTLQIIGNENPAVPATLPDLPDKLLLHLDAADLAAAGLLDGEAVASWQGKDGGATFIQGDTNRQPTFETNVLNGQPAVHFWGAEGDNLNGDRMHSNPSGIDGVTNIFSVTSLEAGATNDLPTMFCKNVDWAEIRVRTVGANPGDTGLYRGTAAALNSADFTFETGDFKVDGVATDAFKMNEHHIVDAQSAPEGYDDMILGDNGGHNRYWKGDIPEFLMYKDLTSTERNLIAWYLQNKYGPSHKKCPIGVDGR
ncbi:MAG: hypothetical protein HQ567_28175, partial [Candidatus Nealsonbacteria bacterium]|nr:hypothetical protein [Candidatus Nealsonbacteria bacterium]